MAKVVYTDTADLDVSIGVQMLRDGGHEVIRLKTSDRHLIVRSGREAQALIVGYARIDEELLGRLPSIELVSLMTTGFDQVDLEAAKRRGLCVANVGGVAAVDVATHALALALALIRGLPTYFEAAQNGRWFEPPLVVPPRTTDLALGILGRGRVGTALLAMAGAVFGRVQFHDPAFPAETDQGVVFDHLVTTSDVLILALPLTAATLGLVDEKVLHRMKPGSYLVNVGRGGVVVGEAARSAVDSGRLRGMAADVLDIEPPPSNHPLLGHSRILITPHIAYLSERTEVEYASISAQNVIDWFAGRPVATAITPVNRRAGAG